MKTKLLNILAALAITFAALATIPASAEFTATGTYGGDGSETAPYIVLDVESANVTVTVNVENSNGMYFGSNSDLMVVLGEDIITFTDDFSNQSGRYNIVITTESTEDGNPEIRTTLYLMVANESAIDFGFGVGNGRYGRGVGRSATDCSSTNPDTACICTGEGDEQVCACDDSYTIDETGICIMNNSCATNAMFDDDAEACICDMGYIGDGTTTCTMMDCGTNAAPNTNRTSCVCDSGYTGDGMTCMMNAPVCATNAMFDDDAEACICDMGYIGDGTTTCTLMNCDTNAAPNTNRTSCVCNSGYTGDGITCALICGANAAPTNNNTECACIAGYTGDGITCTANSTAPPPSERGISSKLAAGIGASVAAYMVYYFVNYELQKAGILTWTPTYALHHNNGNLSYSLGSRWTANTDNWRFYWQTANNGNGNTDQFRYGSGIKYNNGIFFAAMDSESDSDKTAVDLSFAANQTIGLWNLGGGYNFDMQLSDDKTESQNHLNAKVRYTMDKWILSANANTDGNTGTARINYSYRF